MGSNVSHPPSDGAHMSASRMGLKTPPSLQTAVTELMDAHSSMLYLRQDTTGDIKSSSHVQPTDPSDRTSTGSLPSLRAALGRNLQLVWRKFAAHLPSLTEVRPNEVKSISLAQIARTLPKSASGPSKPQSTSSRPWVEKRVVSLRLVLPQIIGMISARNQVPHGNDAGQLKTFIHHFQIVQDILRVFFQIVMLGNFVTVDIEQRPNVKQVLLRGTFTHGADGFLAASHDRVGSFTASSRRFHQPIEAFKLLLELLERWMFSV